MLFFFITITLIIFALLIQYGVGNKALIDVKYNFQYAILCHLDGTEEKFTISKWSDFEDGDQIQFTTTDGVTYLTHASRVILISK